MVDQKKSVVYIPYWIQELCQRHNLPLESVVNYSKISTVLSLEDQALFLGLQSYTLYDCIFNNVGLPKTGSVCITGDNSVTEYVDQWALSDAWKKTIVAEDVSSLYGFETASSLSYSDNVVHNALTARLFTLDAAETRHEKPFITYDLSRDIVGVVVFPGYFNQETFNTFSHELVVSILKVLYVHNTYAAVCKTPYFRKYLETLATVNN